jgi:hypothetical protein
MNVHARSTQEKPKFAVGAVLAGPEEEPPPPQAERASTREKENALSQWCMTCPY